MGRGDKAAAVLGDLVAKGTLTQAQVDAIKKAMSDARDSFKASHDAMRAERTKVITDTLGIDEATLKSKLQAGESLATIAGAKKDALIDALVAYETKKIDEAVAAGKLTAAQASSLKANLKTRITSHIEETKGMGKGHREGHGKGKGHGRGGH
jgi:polyhydroxyalkanoate synthesis regulator phasin